jgi:hypothetical protein
VNAKSNYNASTLKKWFKGRPDTWVQIIASRLALKAFPAIVQARTRIILARHATELFRASLITWAGSSVPRVQIAFAAGEIASKLADKRYISVNNMKLFSSIDTSFVAADLTHSNYWSSFDDVADAAYSYSKDFSDPSLILKSIEDDCSWLDEHSTDKDASRALARQSLWFNLPPDMWSAQWARLVSRLEDIDPNYSVWIDWYERRIRGERAAFDIPGDKRRVEDKKILRRLAEATDEDFWGKGHEYVNATLKTWLDEARARVAPAPLHTEPQTPPQDPGAIAYGVNEQGKLDRLPHSDQVHLRDVPDQRRSYADLRAEVSELLDEGQRLGPRLQPRLERFLQSLPERFEDAEAYLVWRDGNALRRLYFAHRKVANGREPDPARLEAAVAEGLGGLLDLYNNFAFADDGLRAKDEARISPQERASAEVEAAAAEPIVDAILNAPDIATPEARDDIAFEAENASLAADDPYAEQVLDQSNRTKRNIVAGLISDTWSALKNSNFLVQNLVGNAAYEGVKLGVFTVAGIDYAPLLEFIATNGAALQFYVAVAFTSFPNLPDLVNRIGALWNRIRNR